jgi:hypothetical protein
MSARRPQEFRRAAWRRANPPASPADQHRARAAFDPIARAYMRAGARAVVLEGSYARGDARKFSDIDMWVLGDRRSQRTLVRNGFVIHVERTTEAQERARFRDPRRAGSCVVGWREALLVRDPHGLAAQLQRAARRWSYGPIATRCDRWVAAQVADLAEEGVKLVRALGAGETATAAVQRNLIVDRLAVVVAVHRRMLWGSENALWERVARRVGGRWAAAQRRALALGGESIASSGAAALDLYLRTAAMVDRTFDPTQRATVDQVRSIVAALG